MSGAFVVHCHSGMGPAHYDLMLADGASLATWRLPDPPGDLAKGGSMPAKRLAPHRTEYLDYEGPVSGGRGRVDVFDKGSCLRLAAGELCWRVRLDGRRLSGVYELRRNSADSDRWTFSRAGEQARQ